MGEGQIRPPVEPQERRTEGTPWLGKGTPPRARESSGAGDLAVWGSIDRIGVNGRELPLLLFPERGEGGCLKLW